MQGVYRLFCELKEKRNEKSVRTGGRKKGREDKETRADRLLSNFMIFTSHRMLFG